MEKYKLRIRAASVTNCVIWHPGYKCISKVQFLPDAFRSLPAKFSEKIHFKKEQKISATPGGEFYAAFVKLSNQYVSEKESLF